MPEPAPWRKSRVSRVTGKRPERQQPGEDIAGADAGELIRVANQQEMCARCQRFDELIGEEHIEHTGLVDDHQIGVERVFWAPPGLTTGAQLQNAMQGPRRMPGGLRHAFGRPAGGRGQHAAQPLCQGHCHDGTQGMCFPSARAAGQDRHRASQYHLDPRLLLRRQPQPMPFGQPTERRRPRDAG